ncbi:MAG: LPS export ABC transporter periplasmic protein LptC [Candidatus Sabulitectum sp.]|nr:LPS export ABC transporter periplasmic protein LptC [Candidatus Sabulitectum sp.]
MRTRILYACVILIPALIVLTGCGGEPADWSDESGQIQTVAEFRLVQAESGVREWMLSGDSAVYREADSLLFMTEVHILFYENDIPESFVRSDTGVSDLMNGETVLWGNVHAENIRGRTLDTDLLNWSDSLETFETDCLVTFLIPESTGTITTIHGRGVIMDTGLSAVGDVIVKESFNAVTTGELPFDE